MASADTQKLNNRRRRDHPRRDTLPGGTVPRSHARQLDFYQAMADFKHMFPSMEEDVIEAVLRANDGAVDATIDQLLTMSVDADEITCVRNARKHVPLSKENEEEILPPRHTISGISSGSTKMHDSPPSYSEAMRLQHASPQLPPTPGQATLPSNWHQSVHPQQQQQPPTPPRGPHTHKRSLSASGSLLDLDMIHDTTPVSPSLSLTSTNNHTVPKTPYRSSSSSTSSQSTAVGACSSSLRVYRNWNPPMLGTLPDDFLRLNMGGPKSPNNLPPPPPPPALLQQKQQNPSPTMTATAAAAVAAAETNNTMIPPPPPQRKSQRASKTMIISTHEFSKSMLEQKMKENERRRRSTSHDIDPELMQYLDDERLAIVIQNSEFLQELRGNEDFMKTLEKDRMNAAAFEPTALSQPSPTGPKENDIEGYGHDNQETLDAFPFSQPLPSNVDEDAELRRQLKHMGRASKKQFVTLARKFFSRRKKKSSKDILGEKIAPSMANLLEDEEEPEDDIPAALLEERPHFEPLPEILPPPPPKPQPRPSQGGTLNLNNGRRADLV